MNPSAGGDQDRSNKRPLPPELAFLKQPPDGSAMDEREYLEQVQTYLKRVFTHRELMQAHGLDPQQFILTLMPLLRQSKREQAALDAAENVWLEKIADAADAQRNLFQTLRPILEKLYSENPFHPQVREWKEQLDQWAKEMPKE